MAVLEPVETSVTAETAAAPKLDLRAESMRATAATIKPIAGFIYRSMQVGILLVAAGTFLGGWWADVSWGRFWGWDPKEVWALITLLVYLIPLHGRFAGWVNTFWLVMASVACFLLGPDGLVRGQLRPRRRPPQLRSRGRRFRRPVLIATVVILGFASGAYWRPPAVVEDARWSHPTRPTAKIASDAKVGEGGRYRALEFSLSRDGRASGSSPAVWTSCRFGSTSPEFQPGGGPLSDAAPLVLINAVGLTGRLLAMAPSAPGPGLPGLATPAGRGRPAVTCSAQATILTGLPPEGHGIVGNGWYFRDTGEVRFWQQSNALIQAEPLYVTARRQRAPSGADRSGWPSCSGGSTRGRRST